ncbi:hypothetical protein [Tumebacillus lipolyticus]|uniref:Uncharacterized protein n=1 Tax=Tumebacillus lipolyticus TaxID=1280370 RepID=A0ABW4ZSE5_9BACL
MSDEKFDVTFIRGPRDVSPWKQAAREFSLANGRLQTERGALHARAGYLEQRHEINSENFPNASFHQKGRNNR